MIRTYVYVDGLNLYYGAVKRTEFKWLDPVKLAYQVLPSGHTVERLKYFTASVSGARDTGAPRRQQIYLNALATLPGVEIHLGRFLPKAISRPLLNLPVADREINARPTVTIREGAHSVALSETEDQILPVGHYPKRQTGSAKRRERSARPIRNAVIAKVHTLEEKGSDVNLAVHLLNDAWKDCFDVAAVVSNDTDLVEPIRMVAEERGKTVIAVCPSRWTIAPSLRSVATHVRHIRENMLRVSQLPDRIPSTSIMRPDGW